MKKTLIFFLMFILSSQTIARSFGVVGETFLIAEESFLKLIEDRLAVLSSNGELNTLNQQWLKTVANHADRPTPLELPRALRTRLHHYKPEVVLSQAITDINGRILYPIGTRVNALKNLHSYLPCWLFFNADDEAQLHWVQKEMSKCPNPKMILTGGAVSKAERILQNIIYFDQAGRISRKLQISSVPARVQREGIQLRIDELAIKENGDVL
ncbi:type-F conjugative transfer system protein TraW [Legionella quateirensis]|uniref:Type-F conjugative transfer system protein n=1 Tax=Legionella quateirensis TaxID=45072 RepID=A0A378KRA2_9GAMM|nr:type-F conjugative transfer system protein TraW [Legionella quateirensis]KTD47796.1 Type-F conjugative transfer system protein [Legionella quateirensis]STY16689.1 Type-F conjugative transfer system protein [Legionella quateirensis]